MVVKCIIFLLIQHDQYHVAIIIYVNVLTGGLLIIWDLSHFRLSKPCIRCNIHCTTLDNVLLWTVYANPNGIIMFSFSCNVILCVWFSSYISQSNLWTPHRIQLTENNINEGGNISRFFCWTLVHQCYNWLVLVLVSLLDLTLVPGLVPLLLIEGGWITPLIWSMRIPFSTTCWDKNRKIRVSEQHHILYNRKWGQTLTSSDDWSLFAHSLQLVHAILFRCRERCGELGDVLWLGFVTIVNWVTGQGECGGIRGLTCIASERDQFHAKIVLIGSLWTLFKYIIRQNNHGRVHLIWTF